MRTFVFVTSLFVAVVARPEAPYHYNGLQQNHRGLPKNALVHKPHMLQQLPMEKSVAKFAQPQQTYGAPTQQLSAPAPAEESVNPTQSFSAPADDSYNMAYQYSAKTHAEGGYANAQQKTLVEKHIYVHVPPKEFEQDDAIQPRVRHEAGPKRKSYKIVFIKAPIAPAIQPPVVPPAPQNEEKTIIYVLHKRPEEAEDIVIPTPAPTQPSKPEVFFIKYKTKKEQAPVYGPPPPSAPAHDAVDLDIRHIDSNADFSNAPNTNDFASIEGVDMTTMSTHALDDAAQPELHMQLSNELGGAELYAAPNVASFSHNEQLLPHMMTPSKQYLAPQSQQQQPAIVVEEERLPSNSYGPPHRFVVKKKK